LTNSYGFHSLPKIYKLTTLSLPKIKALKLGKCSKSFF